MAKIKPSRIRSGWLTKEEFSRRNEVIAKILCYEENASFHDDLYVLDTILKTLRSERPEVAIIDFIQNVISVGDQYERISRVALEFQRIAKEIDSCLVVVSQLSNRAAREGSESGLLEFKGSGAIAQVCDLGFWLTQKGEDKFELTLRKNRRGPSRFLFNLLFEIPGGRIYES